jgi:hypothetical protein
MLKKKSIGFCADSATASATPLPALLSLIINSDTAGTHKKDFRNPSEILQYFCTTRMNIPS